MANKKLVFVHGSDSRQAATPWMFYHLHPSSYGTKPVRGEGKTFDLVYFDYQLGTRSLWENWPATRSTKPPKDAPTLSEEITPKVQIRDDEGNEIAGPPRPSVLGFYDWVKAQPARSIASIQVFSHAIIPQPVLFPKSIEWGDDLAKHFDLEAPRDHHDTEFRLRDFVGSNHLGPSGGDPWNAAAGSELAKFRDALDTECFIKIWGCGEQTVSHNDGDPIRKLLTDWLAMKKAKNRDVRRAQLILSYLNHVRNFFPYRLAEALRMPVWAGPVGWGSDPNEEDGPHDPVNFAKKKFTYVGTFPPRLDKKELWWRVSANFRGNKGLFQTIYRDTLKAAFDPMGYVEYSPWWFRSVERAMTAIADPPSDSFFDLPRTLMNQLEEQIARIVPKAP